MKELDEIEGVVVQPLRQIADHRGSVLHMMRKDSELFKHVISINNVTNN